ncbi:lipase 3-like [Ostrinia nubilalis]|uniref:lipase 3-like n=1 Tax=Ostrinia nubilalis TaxID=29057 RepID=UPI0030824332
MAQSANTEDYANGACMEQQFRGAVERAGGGLVSSFEKFRNEVESFFKANMKQMERRRVTIKKAFFKFINEAFADDIPAKLNTTVMSHEENSEAGVLMEELVKSHGYKAESHAVVTTDGYVLIVHRILPATLNESATKSGIVLLHHGLFGSSEDWVLLGPKKSLPYLLVNAHYDVWLTNARGNKYSKAHMSRTMTDDEFWNFSWHEIGQFDLSAVIDYIREQNDKDQPLHYVGHSMGATALLALLSTYPTYNQVLKSAVLLAPLAFMYEVKGPIRLLAEFYNQNTFVSLKFLGAHDFAPLEYFPRNFIEKFCKGTKIMCLNPLLLLANGGREIANKTLRQNILNRVPAGGSMKTIIHYIQLVKSGQFQMFDMGRSQNLKKYGRVAPPIYRLNDVTLPVAIFSSSDDWLSTIPDIQSLLSNILNPVIHHVIKRHEFSHTDFVWAEDADVLVYYLILDVLKQITEGRNDKNM